MEPGPCQRLRDLRLQRRWGRSPVASRCGETHAQRDRVRAVIRARAGIAAVLLVTGALVAAAVMIDAFPHEQHATLFVRCETCHLGAAQAGKPLWPAATDCASCHNGTIEKPVSWTPRAGPLPSNLRFTHEAHARAVTHGTEARHCARVRPVPQHGRRQMDDRAACGAGQLSGVPPGPHRHFDADPAQCATCHVPFWQMPPGVTAAQVASWKAPSSHAAPDFQARHGQLAAVVVKGANSQVSAACATCHAREYCAPATSMRPRFPRSRPCSPMRGHWPCGKAAS